MVTKKHGQSESPQLHKGNIDKKYLSAEMFSPIASSHERVSLSAF